ncbi:MAG TPA: hypothetical protein DDW65_07080 [Firmicutes bacterium]|jgi:hypothetical protein|nr:hypothetical protein [Bacillota bacterium]
MAFAVAGCGGGSGSSSSGGPGTSGGVVYSSDYFGLEVGFQLTGSYSQNDNGTNSTGSEVINVMSVTSSSSGAYIFKVADNNDKETLGSSGYYAEKSGSKYYDYGEWEGTTDDLEDTPVLMVTNPVTASFTSPEWGTNKGQVSVTVSAGTFTAWLFENNYTDDDIICCDKRWFVPYLGLVKVIYTETKDGATIWDWTITLNSSAKGVTVTSNTINTSQVKTQSTTKRKHMGMFY